MPGQLPLCHLKAVALRMLLLDASQGYEEELSRHVSWENLQSAFGNAITWLLPTTASDGERLDTFLGRVLADSRPPQLADEHPTAQLMGRMADLASRIDCEACGREAGRAPCLGGAAFLNDQAVVGLAGHCIRPFRAAFNDTLELARTLYRRAAGIDGVQATLTTRQGGPSPLGKVELTLGGECVWDDSDLVRNSEVVLCFHATRIDRRGLDMLAYALAHEVICHVYQFADGGKRLDERTEDCTFAEGWMDYVVRWTVAGGPLSDSATPWGNPAFHDTAALIHELRKQERKLVTNGARVAHKIYTIFASHQPGSGLPRGAWEDFVDLSCSLNASSAWDQRRRGEALARLPRRLGLGGEKPETDLGFALIQWRYERATPAPALAKVIDALSARV